MQSENIETAMRRRPFRPFRIALTTGEHFDVAHPDLAIVGERILAVGSPRGKSTDDDELLVFWIDFNHIVYIRRL